jgi:hypothetical protein
MNLQLCCRLILHNEQYGTLESIEYQEYRFFIEVDLQV